MRYLTPRKSAEGMGAARTGTRAHWFMTMSSVALTILTPCFLIMFGRAIGRDQQGVIEMFAQPFPALVTALLAVVGMRHFAKGAQMMIEDYAAGVTREALVILVNCIAYAVIAVVLFAIAKATFLGVLIGAMN